MKLNRKKTINTLITLIMKRRQSFRTNLNLLLAQWRRNNNIIMAVASGRFSEAQQLVFSQETHSVKKRRIWKFNRDGAFWESNVPQMNEKLFKENFRVTRISFDKICQKLFEMSRQDTVMRPCISLEKRVAIALYALGSSAEYSTVAHLFGVGRSTVGEIVLEFCRTVCRKFQNYNSSYPPTPEEIKRIVEGFTSLGFPQCYGALGKKLSIPAFDQLKGRFRKIGRGLEVNPKNCTLVIKACCLLHNFLKEEEDDVYSSWIEESRTALQRDQPTFISGNDDNINGKGVRDAIAIKPYNENNMDDDLVENTTV